jgi:hypothetical protein
MVDDVARLFTGGEPGRGRNTKTMGVPFGQVLAAAKQFTPASRHESRMKVSQAFRLQTKQFAVWFGMAVVLALLDRLGDGWILRLAQGLVFIAAVTYSVLLSRWNRR